MLVSACVICSSTIADQKAKPDCDAVLNGCLDYAKSLEKERDFYVNAYNRQVEIINELEDKQPSQPWYFYFILGAASAIIVKGVK